jgi:hypothetical protein
MFTGITSHQVAGSAHGERTLTLSVRGVYFLEIRGGSKSEEYRLFTPFWRKRLEGRTYDRIVVTWGYPKLSDTERRLELAWRGYSLKTITHEHFGPAPVQVFAIALGKPFA